MPSPWAASWLHHSNYQLRELTWGHNCPEPCTPDFNFMLRVYLQLRGSSVSVMGGSFLGACLLCSLLLTHARCGLPPVSCCRLSGNANANQNPLLLTITTILVREHNRRARLIEADNPNWEDEKIFQEARK